MTFDQRLALLRERHRALLARPLPSQPARPPVSKQRRPRNPTGLRLSRSEIARSWQKRQIAAGLCMKCARPLVTKNHCAEHAAYHADLKRKGRPPSRVCRCSGCGDLGHQNRTCERRKLVAARSQAVTT